jgi:hypothetical protein
VFASAIRGTSSAEASRAIKSSHDAGISLTSKLSNKDMEDVIGDNAKSQRIIEIGL